MNRAGKPVYEIHLNDRPPPPGPLSIHVIISGAEATGRMIVGNFVCGGGDRGEIVSSAGTLGQQMTALLAAHPEARDVSIFMPPHLNMVAERMRDWIHRAEEAAEA